MDPVEDALAIIRDLVNAPRRLHLLLQDRQSWAQLCSAMDAIGDTQLAIRFYLESPPAESRADGRSYLMVYGVLQALFLQQHAALTLARSLDVSLELPSELKAIRDMRNYAIGHPTARNDGSSAAISRITLTTDGFQMLVNTKDNVTEFRSVGVRDAALQQTAVMGELLRHAADQMTAIELAHRRQFRDHPLIQIWSPALGYMVEKIGEALWSPSSSPFAIAGIQSIREALVRLRNEVHERNLTEAYRDSVGRTSAEIEFVLRRLESRLSGNAPEWEETDVQIYFSFLGSKVREMEAMANEIDAEYASDET